MSVDEFANIANLLCEPARAKMLWNLLDGRAYTAGELAIAGDISPTSASNHLAKLLEAGILRVESQGRHRYYSFSNPEVAYVIEAMANLGRKGPEGKKIPESGIRFCRTCYDHLAGFIGVKITDALEQRSYLEKSGDSYEVTAAGWIWLSAFGILKADLENKRRPVTRQCLDWSERRPHLAGQLGATLLEKMLQRRWFNKVQFSRELILTPMGRLELHEQLGVRL